ncbi:MAG: bifunctional diaminohydroxyphosphoribosylaminopyrimidine deaminase/5-amino-6-(5-phosphoribosylamino)uracil reductase RibD [Candidatus Eisenbacteria bacterium]|nr:bifunctional diaminohydroxyphosphoribosylaminopyrimidine deaminase/5-amino-6-(5-phosphoribosylamino)uracil reductase RibD [Candidatus Eisenbacteria bacterium]
MKRALALAERGRGRTRPNPIVGAVVVRGARVVGEGWHTAAGQPHAEAVALRRAGRGARGATLYVTLEPCAHTGRTPPCVDAIAAAGIRRCVVAIRDPHVIVNGRGLRRLRERGVRVEVGVCAQEARAALEGYRLAHLEGRPRVTWKLGATLDGRVADAEGRSRWITSRASREHAQRARAQSDAIVIGAGTARADDPRLTARGARVRMQPLRVVCDTRLSLPLSLRLFGALARGTVVACAREASAARSRALERRGVKVWRLPRSGVGISTRALARRLAAAGCHDVLLESGPALGAAWLRSGLIDEWLVYVAPRVLGGEALGWPGALGPLALPSAIEGRVIEARRLGRDALLRVEVRR